MRNRLLIMIGVLLLSFLAIPASAQCGLYTYQDGYIDSNGNFVATNSAQADCVRSTAYAETHVRMPSGNLNAASATGVTFAEAVASLLATGESGIGDLWGFDDASSLCWDSDTSFDFDWPIEFDLAYTKSKYTGT